MNSYIFLKICPRVPIYKIYFMFLFFFFFFKENLGGKRQSAFYKYQSLKVA